MSDQQNTSLTVRPQMAVGDSLSVKDILDQKALIQDAMKAAMQDGQHFGKIPGCGDKPTLLQPGAQTILLLFRLNPDYEVTQTDLGNHHREYSVKCRLTSASGVFVGAGLGSCSTMEAKYRYRVAPKTLTDQPVPKMYWELRKSDPAAAQALIGGKGFSTRKDEDGNWMIAEGSSEKIEHDNPADYYNTCLKMACKRALVSATLTRTAASDIFSQDLEELRENAAIHEAAGHNPPPAKTTPQPVRSTRTASAPAPHDTTKRAASKVEAQPAGNATEGQRVLMLKALKDIEQDLFAYAVDRGIIIDTEGLEDWPLDKVVVGGVGIVALRKAVELWKRGESAAQSEHTSAALASWREFPVPFGKNKDLKLGELSENSLKWYVNAFEVETEYNGKPVSKERLARDTAFRQALDAARDELCIEPERE